MGVPNCPVSKVPLTTPRPTSTCGGGEYPDARLSASACLKPPGVVVSEKLLLGTRASFNSAASKPLILPRSESSRAEDELEWTERPPGEGRGGSGGSVDAALLCELRSAEEV